MTFFVLYNKYIVIHLSFEIQLNLKFCRFLNAMLIGFPATTFNVNTKRQNYTGFYSVKRKQIAALPRNISVFSEKKSLPIKRKSIQSIHGSVSMSQKKNVSYFNLHL